MSIAEPTASEPAPPAAEPAAAPKPARRALRKRATHLLRRGHLYMGLFLFPWAILYGFTGFLFNHPFSFRDTPNAAFHKEALVGTPLEAPPAPTAQAESVVAKLNEQQKPATPYKLLGEAKYGPREVAFVTVKYKDVPDKVLSVSFNLKQSAGGVHYEANREPKPTPKAPFAAGPAVSTGRFVRGAGGPRGGQSGGPTAAIKLDDRIEDRIRETVPTVLERTGFPPADEIVVSSVPDITFPLECNGERWTAVYNPMTGGVGGIPEGSEQKTEMGWRRFVTQLHLVHVYPYETNARWFWALVVDAMALTMCFWGLSGLVMWWQIKATRRAGFVVLLLSTAAATALGFAMHAAMTS